MDFTGKVVLITGASSGIGAETAVHFAKYGAELVITGRSTAGLAKTAILCSEVSKKNPFIVSGDLTNDKYIKELIEKTIFKYNRLDILINNAGIVEFGSIENTSLEQFDRLFNVNVRSMYNLTMQAVPHLIKSKGNIVNVSSVNGLRGFSGILAYSMTKSAVDQFTQCIALELASKHVRVNSVNPGVIMTEVHRRAGLHDVAYAEFLERAKQTHALGRAGNPSEVGLAILFLASNWASFITGVNLPVDGGRHAMCPR